MARNDANPPMPEFSTSYVLQEVDPNTRTHQHGDAYGVRF